MQQSPTTARERRTSRKVMKFTSAPLRMAMHDEEQEEGPAAIDIRMKQPGAPFLRLIGSNINGISDRGSQLLFSSLPSLRISS
jgi:hypothetical protein